MSDLDESLGLLTWVSKAANAVRTVLADLNVPLPAAMAQGLGLAILALIAFYLGRLAWKAENGLPRMAQAVGAGAAAVAGLSIAYAWFDEWANPPSLQLVADVQGAPMEAVSVDLLDYRDQSLGATVEKDRDTGLVSITYRPAFADPPSAVAIRAPGCGEGARVPLSRAHLKLGMRIAVRLECQESG